jgi:ABC-type branched-subunit amino acid transport system ATPase component
VILWLQALVDTSGGWSLLIYAVVFLLVAFYLPGGIIGALREGWRRLAGPGTRPPSSVGTAPLLAADAGEPPAADPGEPPAADPGEPPAADAAQASVVGAASPPGAAGQGMPPARGAPSPAGAADPRERAGLVVHGVSKSFGGVAAVRDVSLEVRPGTIVALIGSNGAGKSTLVNVISGIDRPDAGAVLLDGRDLTALRAPERTRAGIARTFQVPRLVDELTITDNLVLGEEAAEGSFFRRSPAREAAHRQRALARLAEGGLSELAGRRAGSLGTGERKFAELVRALIANPAVCLLDEPAVGLSLDEIAHLSGWLLALRDSGAAVLVIDHNLDFIHGLADLVYVMDLGQIIKKGTAQELVGTQDARASLLSGGDGGNAGNGGRHGERD